MTGDEQNSPPSESVMNGRAEFTLRLVRAGQEALNPRSSLRNWFFFPEHQEATWSQAREILAAAEKPLVVAPLVEPGSIAIWSVSAIEPGRRARVDRHFANQFEYYEEKLAAGKLGDTDHIETPDGLFALTVAEFRRWAAEYTVPIGIGMGASPVAGTGRIHLRVPGGGGPHHRIGHVRAVDACCRSQSPVLARVQLNKRVHLTANSQQPTAFSP